MAIYLIMAIAPLAPRTPEDRKESLIAKDAYIYLKEMRNSASEIIRIFKIKNNHNQIATLRRFRLKII
jgi:hypothetical protein